jgi:hypothetical protein
MEASRAMDAAAEAAQAALRMPGPAAAAASPEAKGLDLLKAANSRVAALEAAVRGKNERLEAALAEVHALKVRMACPVGMGTVAEHPWRIAVHGSINLSF